MNTTKLAGLRRVKNHAVCRGCWAILLVAMSLQGCTHTTRLSATAPQSSYDRANSRLAHQTAQVRLDDGGLFELYNVQFGADSARWVSPTEGRVTLPAQTLLSAEIKSASRGMLDGALIGGVVGIGIGVLAENDDTYDGCEGSCVLQMTAGGILWGVMIGAFRKSTTKIVRQN